MSRTTLLVFVVLVQFSGWSKIFFQAKSTLSSTWSIKRWILNDET
jgi:hypothetical protein